MSENKAKTIAQRLREEEALEQQKKEQDIQLNEVSQKYIEPLRTQRIELDTSQKSGEQGFVQDFIDQGFKQTKYFLQSIFGMSYQPLNKLGYDQKQKIIRYVFTANNYLQDQVKEFHQKNRHQDHTTFSWQIKEREKLKLINRAQYIQALAESRNRIAVMGYCWGAFTASILHLTIFRTISFWRKIALWITVFHASGQLINYLNLDRFFDKVYPFYLEDLKVYQLKQKFNNENEDGKVKKDEIDNLMAQLRVDTYYEKEVPSRWKNK